MLHNVSARMAVILYIEDNPQNMRLVRKMLSVAGYTMLEAVDGMSGIQLAMTHLPSLILMDIHLPDIDGIEVTARIKADPLMRHIPIIAITADVFSSAREHYISAGCDGYLAKPISRHELLSTVATFLTAY